MKSEQTKRILIVDDQADFAQGLSMLLRVRGFEVEVAGDGEAGWEQIQSRRPEVILLDLGLPRLDGYEVARRTRGLDPAYVPRLIALSGYDLEDSAETPSTLFNAHFFKPVDLPKLLLELQAG